MTNDPTWDDIYHAELESAIADLLTVIPRDTPNRERVIVEQAIAQATARADEVWP